MMGLDIGYMLSLSSLYSHHSADVEKGSAQVNKLYYDAMANLPYLVRGKAGIDPVTEERDKAIERYRKLRASALKKRE